MALASGNPALKAMERTIHADIDQPVMTVQGTVNKILILMGCLLLTATYAWSQAKSPNIQIIMFGGLIGGLIFSLITIFKPNAAPFTAPIYAMCQGLFLGALSAVVQNAVGPNVPIVMQAAGLTFATLVAMGIAYKTGVIKVTAKFRAGVVAATGAVFLVYFVTMILRLFGVDVPFIHQGGAIGIGISLVVIVIAALNLTLDFDFIERGAENNLPKNYEWYGAFGLMVTLVWLYLEILRLLLILAANRD